MKKIILTGALALSLGLASCDNYLDINQSPNSPAVENLTASMIFPGAEMAMPLQDILSRIYVRNHITVQ